jgi:hypothetical protein
MLTLARTWNRIMWRSLLSWLGSVLVLLACFVPTAWAQAEGAPVEGGGGQGGAFPGLMAVVFTVLIMLVVCMPSRKN